MGSPYDKLSLMGDIRGCHVPLQQQTSGLGALFPPVALIAHDKENSNPCTRYVAVLAQA
jgi:hypothetical protein